MALSELFLFTGVILFCHWIAAAISHKTGVSIYLVLPPVLWACIGIAPLIRWLMGKKKGRKS